MVQTRTLLYTIFDRNGTPFMYRKIPIISPGFMFVQKAYFRGRLFLEGLIIGTNFAFQNALGLTLNINTTKTASTKSLCAYVWEGLL